MAQVGIMNLPPAPGLDGREYVPLLQAGVTVRATVSQVAVAAVAAQYPAKMEFVIDGGGLAITPQVWGYLTVPFNGEIIGCELLADVAGTVACDVWKCAYAVFNPPIVPSVANSICGATPPALVSASKYNDGTLTGWDTSLDDGDILAFVVKNPGSTAITRVSVILNLLRTI